MLLLVLTNLFLQQTGNKLLIPVCNRNRKAKNCWDPSLWNSDFEYVTFWEKQSKFEPPFEHKKYNDIVHLRCGDILKGGSTETIYKLPCASCIKSRVEHVDIIVGGHGPAHQDQCGGLAMLYGSLLANRTTIHSGNHADYDWHRLFYSVKVTALVPSSFVFSAKVGDLDNLKMFTDGNSSAKWWVNCPMVIPTGKWIGNTILQC